MEKTVFPKKLMPRASEASKGIEFMASSCVYTPVISF